LIYKLNLKCIFNKQILEQKESSPKTKENLESQEQKMIFISSLQSESLIKDDQEQIIQLSSAVVQKTAISSQTIANNGTITYLKMFTLLFFYMKLTICETKLIILCLLDFKIKQATTHIT
jgi:hypothetical protein